MSHEPQQQTGSIPNENTGLVLGLILLLVRKRLFLALNLAVTSLVALGISFALPKAYVASAVFLPPSQAGMGISGLLGGIDIGSSLLEGKNIIGSNQVSALFHSQQLRKTVIDKEDLISRYGIAPEAEGKYFRAYKKFAQKIRLESDKDMGVGLSSVNSFTIEVEDARPDSAYIIAKSVFVVLDSAMRKANVEDASRKRQFAEKQLANRIELLRQQEMNLVAFQKKTKIYDISSQGGATIRVASELRAKLIEMEFRLAGMENSQGKQSSSYMGLLEQKIALEKALSRLETSGQADVLPSLSRGADHAAEYLELKRDVEISIAVINLLSQQLEMSRLDEAKEDSPLKLISAPMIPDYKSRPKKLFVILTILAVEHILLLMLIVLMYIHQSVVRNSSEWAKVRAAISKG